MTGTKTVTIPTGEQERIPLTFALPANLAAGQYMIDAINKYGPFRGSWRGIKRVCRCHPWGPAGHDPA